MPPSKSSKQRASELKAKRAARTAKRDHRIREDLRAFKIGQRGLPPGGAVHVNPDSLEPDGSYDTPAFVERGFYVDLPFTCVDCGKPEVWTATQQKWWYEVAKGGVWTIARRCRPCRRREREKLADHKRKSAEGKLRKARLKAEGKWRRGF